MNLLLVERHELDDAGRVQLTDRRHEHLRDVLKIAVGDPVQIGVLDGDTGSGEVESHDEGSTILRCRIDTPPPPRSDDLLILAVPRPVVLIRCLEAATTLGFGRIALLRTRLVDKSHLMAKAIQPDAIQDHLRRGLEQGARTHRPEVVIADRFRPFVEDRLEELCPRGPRLVGHPDTDASVSDLDFEGADSFTLAIGPERGFTDHEIDELTARGFGKLSAGPGPLRVETALAYLTGVLHRDRAARRST